MSLKKISTLVIAGALMFSGISVASAQTSSFDLSCVHAAIDARETGLQARVDTLTSSVKTALQIRGVELKAAWAKQTPQERKVARKEAWRHYKTSVDAAHATARAAKKTIHTTYKTAMRACGVDAQAVAESE